MVHRADPSPLSAGVYTRPCAARTDAPDPILPDDVPTPDDLAAARRTLGEHGLFSPSYFARRLSSDLDRDIWVKYETFSPIRSFKLRGALWAVHTAATSGASSIVTASTGNHGQGVALAGLTIGLPVTVFMPAGVDPVKQRQMQDLGADLQVSGRTLTDAEGGAVRFATDHGGLYIEDGENAGLMAGAASIGLEILEQVPGVDTIIAPVGGGNLAAGVCLALRHSGADARAVGVQSTAAPGATASWLAGSVVRRPCATLAGGLATDRPGRLSLSVLRDRLDAMCLVDEEDLWRGIRLVYDWIGYGLELAAVAPFMALHRFGDSIPGERVVIIASGACIDPQQLAAALSGQSLASWIDRVAASSA
jgi:threonine dehydratase